MNQFRGSDSFFSLPGRSPGRAIVLPAASVLALAKSLTLKFFYLMGKALSGELSFPVTGLVFCFFFGKAYTFRQDIWLM